MHIILSIVKSLAPQFYETWTGKSLWHDMVIKFLRPYSNYGITYRLLEHETLCVLPRDIFVCFVRFSQQTQLIYRLVLIEIAGCLSDGGRNWHLKTAFEVWNHFVMLFPILRLVLPCVIFSLYHLNKVFMYFSSSPYFQLIYIHFITIILREEYSVAYNSFHPFLTCIFFPHDLLFHLLSKILNSPLLS